MYGTWRAIFVVCIEEIWVFSRVPGVNLRKIHSNRCVSTGVWKRCGERVGFFAARTAAWRDVTLANGANNVPEHGTDTNSPLHTHAQTHVYIWTFHKNQHNPRFTARYQLARYSIELLGLHLPRSNQWLCCLHSAHGFTFHMNSPTYSAISLRGISVWKLLLFILMDDLPARVYTGREQWPARRKI